MRTGTTGNIVYSFYLLADVLSVWYVSLTIFAMAAAVVATTVTVAKMSFVSIEVSFV